MKKNKKNKIKCFKCNRALPTDWYPTFIKEFVCPICYSKILLIERKNEVVDDNSLHRTGESPSL